MSGPDRIEGLAIVSADGMIADKDGVQPPSLKIEADQKFFFETLSQGDALAHGRHSAETEPPTRDRRRIVLTREVAGVAPIPGNPAAVNWNPAGASIDDAWRALGLSGGLLVVLGGTEPFGVFLPRYTTFHLTRAPQARLPNGRPVFPGVPARTPEELLRAAGLTPAETRVLDEARQVVLTTWRR